MLKQIWTYSTGKALFITGVGNLQPAGQKRPAWTFDLASIRIFVTRVRVQHRVKTKL